MPGVRKRILGMVCHFAFEIPNKNAPQCTFSLCPGRTYTWCLFAYSLAYSEQNNSGIVIDVIRKMIKQALFATFTPSSSLKLIGVTLIALLNYIFYCGEWLLMTISVHANKETLGMWWIWEKFAVVKFRSAGVTSTDKTVRGEERARRMYWAVKLIWNSSVLVIIREPQQPLLNYRSHRHDWMRLGHCNTDLIIYRLYYYSNSCMETVSTFPVLPHIRDRKELFARNVLQHFEIIWSCLKAALFYGCTYFCA